MRLRTAVTALSLALAACERADVDQGLMIVVPADVESIASGTLRVSLYRYDPNWADSPATRVSLETVPFAHQEGVATIKRVRLVADGAPGERFYVVVEGCVGVEAVLWDGLLAELPHVVTMRPRPSPAPCATDAA